MAFSEVFGEFSWILNTGKLVSKRSSMHSNRLLPLQLAVFRLRFGPCGTPYCVRTCFVQE